MQVRIRAIDRAFVWGDQLCKGSHPMVDAFCSTHLIDAENPASMAFLLLELGHTPPKFNIAP